MRNVYLVRHCKAAGQEPNAPLTDQGTEDCGKLIDFFKDKNINTIYSSPFLRALETIKPFADFAGLEIIVDERLRERELSTVVLEDWMDKLRATYEDLDLRFEGGETSREAMSRGIACIEEMLNQADTNIVVVSHGALLSLMIKYYMSDFGFEGWKTMRNPDIYHLRIGQAVSVSYVELS